MKAIKSLLISSMMLLHPISAFSSTNSIPESFKLLVEEDNDGHYVEYRAYIDTDSIKKVGQDTSLFNMIVFGLDLDRDTIYPEGKAGDSSESVINMDNSRLVITGEIACRTKAIKPIKYLSIDVMAGTQDTILANDDDGILPTTSQDKSIIQKIHQYACQ